MTYRYAVRAGLLEGTNVVFGYVLSECLFKVRFLRRRL